MKTNTNEAEKRVENEKSGTQTGHSPPVSHFPADLAKAEEKADRAAKSSVEYWKGAVTSRTIRGKPTAELYARFREGGRDCWVCLNTPNKATAATKARDLWLNVKAKGLDVAVAEFRPKSAPRAARSATVGEVIAAAKTVSSVRPSTFNQYEISLRRLAAGVLGIKAEGAVFYHRSPEAKAWRAKVEGVSLDEVAPENWTGGIVKSKPKIERSTCPRNDVSIIPN